MSKTDNYGSLMELHKKIEEQHREISREIDKENDWKEDDVANLILSDKVSDLAEMVNELSDRIKLEIYEGKNLRLGQLIESLENCDPESVVVFDDGYYPDVYIESYRGNYRHASVVKCDITIKAGEWAKCLRRAVGDTRTGYKGGEFKMFLETPLWQSEYGQSSGIAIVGVNHGFGQTVILATEHIPD